MTASRYSKARLLLASTLLLASGACTATLDWEDPIVEPSLIAGSGNMDDFDAFEPGDPMVIHSGLQAGLWLMPTLRHQGLGSDPEIHCVALDLDRDVILAEGIDHGRSYPFEDWLNIPYNMKVTLPDLASPQVADLEDYAGDRILFECSSADEYGTRLDVSLEMTLRVM